MQIYTKSSKCTFYELFTTFRLELDSPVEFKSHIVPVCLPNDDEEFLGRKGSHLENVKPNIVHDYIIILCFSALAFVTGWGRLKYGTYDLVTLHLRYKFNLKYY